jgi:hypothetical protein
MRGGERMQGLQDQIDQVVQRATKPGRGAESEIRINPDLLAYGKIKDFGDHLMRIWAIEGKTYKGHRLVVDPSATFVDQVVQPARKAACGPFQRQR